MKITNTKTWMLLGALAVSPIAVSSAQTAYPELEPNGPKTEATAVQCLHDGDSLIGTTTGSSILPGDAGLASADTFRMQTCALPLAIYRHRLVLTSAALGQTGFLRGRNQTGRPGLGGTIGGLDVEVQRSWSTTSPQNINQWYGFGKSEEVYYRIEGTPATLAPYTVILNTTAIDPVQMTVSFFEGDITIATVGLGHTTDTDLWVYNDALEPMFKCGNDNQFNPPSAQSMLVRNLTPGTYYLAITDTNLANDQASPLDDGNPTQNVVDFPNMVVGSSELTNVDVSFAVSDTYGHLGLERPTKAGPYDVLWYRFVVLPHPYTSHTFCAGDGHPGSQPCPCNNYGAPDHGCAGLPNTAGAYLDSLGTPSVLLDSMLLRAGDLPHGTTCLFFQGTVLTNAGFGTPFNDGLLCASGTQRRLGVKVADPFGEAVFGYQQPGDPLLHTAGGIPPLGGTYTYQVWYRNNQGPCGTHSNTSNGLLVNWGQ
jgi:hypothetical protein